MFCQFKASFWINLVRTTCGKSELSITRFMLMNLQGDILEIKYYTRVINSKRLSELLIDSTAHNKLAYCVWKVKRSYRFERFDAITSREINFILKNVQSRQAVQYYFD